MLRNYFLGEIHVAGEESNTFHLVFTTFGTMFVQKTREIYAAGSRKDVVPIRPEDLDKHTVGGKTLKQIVTAKLSEILPSSY